MILRLTSLGGEPVLFTGETFIVHHAPKGTAAVVNCSLVQSDAGQVYVRESVDEIERIMTYASLDPVLKAS